MKRLFNKIILALVCMAIYILYTGLLTELTILTGILISIPLSLAFDKFLIEKGVRPKDVVKIVYLVKYVILFAIAELKDHIKMVKIVLGNGEYVNPDVVEVPLDLESDYGITLVALTITNIPGTIAIHIDKSKKILYVHWLTARKGSAEEIKKEIVGDFEDIAKKIFG